VDIGAAVVADEQPPELAEPGKGTLNDPADTAQTGAVVGLAVGDLGCDPALAELATVVVVVVAAVSRDALGPAARPADPPRTAGTASMSGISWVTSLRLPPVSVQASGIPVASTRR
jgi:hypothetical protein